MARDAMPSSVIASRYPLSASGSPHPGHMWCSWVRRSSGSFLPTWRILTLVISLPRSSELPLVVGERRHRLVAVQRKDPLTDELDVEQRADPEAGAVCRDSADEADGGTPQHAEPDVVDHLTGA